MTAFTLVVQSGVQRQKTAAPIDWRTLGDAQFQPQIDSRLVRAQKLMNTLEIRGGGLDEMARLQAQKRLQNLMRSIQQGGQEQLSRGQMAAVAERASKGLNPRGNFLHRLSFGLLGTGPMGNPNKQVPRLKDINAALGRAEGLVPENIDELVAAARARVGAGARAGRGARAAAAAATTAAPAAGGMMGWFKGLSTPAKFGLGAAALGGGAYLANHLLSNKDEAPVPPPDAQQIWR